MQNLCSFWLGKDFLHMMLEVSSSIKEQIDKLDFTKLKTYALKENMTKRIKIQVKEKIFTIHIPDK